MKQIDGNNYAKYQQVHDFISFLNNLFTDFPCGKMYVMSGIFHSKNASLLILNEAELCSKWMNPVSFFVF